MHRRTTELRPYRFGSVASTPFGGHARDPPPTPSGARSGPDTP